ncbi:MAG: hypothetical protein AAF518_22465 [Spirochaetota bacterium]
MRELMEKVDTLQRAHEEFTRMVGMEYNKLIAVQKRADRRLEHYIKQNEKREQERKEEFRKYEERKEKEEQQRKEEFRKYEERKEREELQWKEEFRKYEDESKQERIKLNKQMGELSRKFGTIVEDMVVPSLPRILQEKFAIPINDDVERNRRFKKDGRNKEFDAYVVTKDCVFLNYTVATLKNDDINWMAKEIEDFRFFLPEHANKKIIGILAALHIPNNLLRYAEKKGYLIIGLGEYLMESKNKPNFIPTEF